MYSNVNSNPFNTGIVSLGILLLFSSFSVNSQNSDSIPEFNLVEGIVNETLKTHVNSSEQTVVYYTITNAMIIDPAITSIKIEANVHHSLSDHECPLLFSVREAQAVVSWQLPTFYGKNKELIYHYAARILCIDSSRHNKTLAQTIVVAVSTCSEMPIEFDLLLTISHNIVVRADQLTPTRELITPTSPVFYKFNYPDDIEHVMIALTSESNTCMTFSVQEPTCPVFDQPENIQFQGYWQTMTTQASITIRKKHYPDGFFLVFAVLFDDKPCHARSGLFEEIPRRSSRALDNSELLRGKNITFNVHSVIEPSEYVKPTLVPLAFIFAILIILFVVFSIFQHLLLRMKQSANKAEQSIVLKGRGARFQSQLCLDDLKEKNLQVLQKQSNRYYWSIVTIGIFYCVPVFQLIINYLKVLYSTGDYDLCYYNYRCARPLGYVMDFNHIYSNIGYVLFGLFFILFVKLRQASLGTKLACEDTSPMKSEILENAENQGFFRRIFPRIIKYNLEYGTLQHFGIYYALGVALILEGALSAAYHICPNQSNFQFDTSFMYVIAVLGIVKVYQFRHPVYLSANITFISLAFVAASSVFGLLFNNLAFKICFSVIHFFGIVSILLYLYNIGYFTEDGIVVTGWLDIYRGVLRLNNNFAKTRENSSRRGRLVLPILAMLLNITIIIMIWTVMSDSNFATQLLAIFVANFAVYMFYYGIMKFIHNEYKAKLWIQLLIYGVFAAGLWILSLNYFRQALSSWEESPAESRALNGDCIVFEFYDNHDMWHFTSSAALFCSFMLLLTLDDDLITTRHEDIPVF